MRGTPSDRNFDRPTPPLSLTVFPANSACDRAMRKEGNQQQRFLFHSQHRQFMRGMAWARSIKRIALACWATAMVRWAFWGPALHDIRGRGVRTSWLRLEKKRRIRIAPSGPRTRNLATKRNRTRLATHYAPSIRRPSTKRSPTNFLTFLENSPDRRVNG